MKYEKAEAKIVMFDNSDVITASGSVTESLGGNEWNQEELDKEYGCDGLANHVDKSF